MMMLMVLKLLMMLMKMVLLMMMLMMIDDEDDEIYASPCHKKHFARAGAVEMHMELSQEEFCAEIYSEKATH